MIYTDEFELVGEPRRIDDAAVEQLDAALAQAATAPIDLVMHAVDPRRVLRFDSGGPPVWSVALCPCADGSYLFVTYGLSRFIQPDSPFAHEMSLRVSGAHTGQPPAWPTFLLRQLARYQITSGRELKVGDPMSFGESITRAAMAPEHKASMPDSPMHAIGIAADPSMQSVRRVVGLMTDELALTESWSTAGLLGEIARRDAALKTDIGRASWATDSTLLQAVRQGAERDGSDTGAMVVPGVRWARRDDGFELNIPGGPVVNRIAALLRGRVGFGRPLMLHDYAEMPYSEVRFTPSDREFVRAHADRLLEIGLQEDSLMLFGLKASAAEVDPSPLTLYLR